MNETPRPHRESAPDPTGGLGHPFDQEQPEPLVTVAAGIHSEQLPVGHLTVGEIRSRFRDRFDIAPNSQALLDGHHTDEQVEVRPGQLLTFIHPAGEKGCMPGRIDSESNGISQ
jgi:hypothetical protein